MSPEDLATTYAQQTAGIQRGNTGASGGFASAAAYGKAVPQTQVVKPPGLPGIVQKGVDIASQTGNILGNAAGKAGEFVFHSAVDIAKQTMGAARTFVDAQTQPIMNQGYADLTKQLGDQQNALMTSYKSGKMSKQDYLDATGKLNAAFNQLNTETQKISAGPTPIQRAEDVANTAINVLSLGSFTTAESLGKEAVTPLVGKFEDVLTKVPAVKALAERNAQTLLKNAGQQTFDDALKTNAKQIAIGLLIKRPVFYQTNIQGGKEIYDKLLSGNYSGAVKQAAWLGTQMLEGGPLGAFAKGASWLKKGLGELSYGKGSFIDGISSQIGNKNPTQIARFLTTLEQKAPDEFQKAQKVFRILQETNLQTTNNDVGEAVNSVLTHYQQHAIPLENLTPSQIYKDFSNWAEADSLAQKTLRSGLVKDINPEDAQKYVVVRWDTPTKNAVADAVSKAGVGIQDQLNAMNELASRPGVGWGNNDILKRKLENAIASAQSPEEAAKAIRQISTASTLIDGVPKKVGEQLAELGYSIARPAGNRRTPIVDENNLSKLVTGAIKGNSDVFDISHAPNPDLAALASALDKAGLSPRSANQVATRKLSENVVAELDNLHVGKELGLRNTQGGDILNGGQAILSTLQKYVENKRSLLNLGHSAAVTDIRQLHINEIRDALKVSHAQAVDISRAIMDGYLKVPLEFRGLGDKVVDALYRYNPLQKYYSRIQSALRYSYNPFFRVQESIETKMLAHAQSGNLIWGKSKGALDEAASMLDKGGILTSSLPGQAAEDQVLGRITANITAAQKRDLAGLALDMAQKRGIPLQEMINLHSDELDDALRVVVQYPRQGILASPLARTLNLAFFPMRYNAKVTMLAGKVLAKQPPSVQLAVIHSLFQMKDWLKSDEGIKWQSTHADAIQLFNWATPVNSIEYTFNLLGHKPNQISDLGQLGGLPMGVITQILDGQGIIHLSTPYVDPKTGSVFPTSTPESLKARAATAMTDLLGTMFTFPGRTLGLPGKDASIRKFVSDFIATNGSDFSKNVDTSRLTPLQKNWVRVLQGDTSKGAIDSLYNSPLPGGYQGYTLPPLSLPYKVVPPTTKQQPLIPRTGLPSRSKHVKPIASPVSQEPLP